ncbi:beta-propeller domain-containing protein, methanol dehydrogenase [Polaromonas sp. CF318]|uniref:TPM domain-containing protein n=1 Tax=Polaromonas sp. CF318 TaxID=1144318 RepID=UPI00027144F1|nr:TPM domain-containing protein [Polaromonas sp. CF318]EJL79031.1 beta-propeller domain-containing protein, methanol dehydrogenase [Polaromonas sp. CF318]
MPHLQATLPSSATPATRRLHKALAALWASLCLLAAGAMAAPTDVAGAAASTDAAVAATPADAVQVAVPPYSARVLDTTGTLNTAQVAALNEQILALEADTRAAVVVFMLPTTGEETLEQYATRVFDKWKIGDTARDDGILILVALQDRRMRIEVGQGLEGSVPDVLAGRIIDEQMKPRFRSNDYAGGLEAAIHHIGALVRGDVQPPEAAERGVTPFGWAFFASLLWGFALGVVRARRNWTWALTIALVASGPLVVAAVLKSAAIGAILLTFPVPLAFALGFGCGRSRTLRRVAGGIALVIGLMVGIAYAVGANSFGVGLLYAAGGAIACLLLGLIGAGAYMAFKRSLLEFGVRCAVVAGIVGYVAFENQPDLLFLDWESWLPTGIAAGLAMLFGFFPGSASTSSGGRTSSGGGSSSSSSSSSRSSSGGSSSGGGASGSW